MIEALRPYSECRPAKMPWLSQIPTHWVEKRAKYFYREVDERSMTGDEELMSVSHKTGVTPRPPHVTMFKAESNVGHKICRPEDLVINTMWAFMAALGVAKQVGVVSPSYGVYRPLRSSNLHPEYVDRLLRIEDYKSEYLCRSKGIRSSRLRLYPEQFLRIPILCPPADEQAAIVRFLDRADRRIRRYVRAKRQLIALLNEQRQAIIHRAVTRGLDPNVRLKPSEIDWLGDVPQHWKLSRVKSEFLCLNNRRIPLSSPERGLMKVRQYDYYGASSVIDKVDDYIFDDELLLMAEDGANLVLRNLPLAIIARGKFWVNNHAHILKPRNGNLEYLACLMETLNYLPWISGAAQPKLTKDRLLSIAIAVPTPGEQDRIVQRISDETRPLTITIQQAKRKAELIREYRTRLIADVVTGKLDVRDAAARVPDEADEPEGVAEDLLEGEEAAVDAELDDEPKGVEA